MRAICFFLVMVFYCQILPAQVSSSFTHADSLRGSITPARAWWDLTYYNIDVRVDPKTRSIAGKNTFNFKILAKYPELQLDLQSPLVIDSIIGPATAKKLKYRRDGNAYFVQTGILAIGTYSNLTVYYHGVPRVAVKPPWDGGFTWAKDKQNKDWVGLSCQGFGASVWLPCKDHQYDEPDSVRLRVTVPRGLVDVSGGRLQSSVLVSDSTEAFTWLTKNPINNYDISINIADYAHFSDVYQGLNGQLTLDYWVLRENLAAAKRQFAQVKPMLSCFESWFGPYPFYDDGYKLIETPFLGMEHQGAVAYGNGFHNGYLGTDLSGTGLGLNWDFIIVHESAHEWFGNNITSKDIADMWIHEAFACYAESLFIECRSGKKAGERYLHGLRKNILNDKSITGAYDVNNEGSEDMYYKGANMLGTLRSSLNNDSRWRSMLRGLNKNFYHRTVTGPEFIAYLSTATGINFTGVVKDYLTYTALPVLEYSSAPGILRYRWASADPVFDLAVKVFINHKPVLLKPSTTWQTLPGTTLKGSLFVDPGYYVLTQKVR